MMKAFSLLVAVSTTALLGGCELYFDDKNDDSWTYCGSDGYYQCQGDDCDWASPTCPDQGSTGSGTGQPGGFDCQVDADCAAGCYCAENGTCEEAGFCTQDSDCGAGYTCDESRSSCEPADPGPATCNYDNECATGEYCSPATNTCTTTCVCTNDQAAIDGGYGWCDETRSTCLPGEDPAGSCGGAVTCSTAQPTCPAGEVPTSVAGCWTGQCKAYGSCDVAPGCTRINDQTNCLSRAADCSAVYSGLNCTKPDGSACQDGDTNCTCANFVFSACRDRTAMPRNVMVRDQYGHVLDASQLILNP